MKIHKLLKICYIIIIIIAYTKNCKSAEEKNDSLNLVIDSTYLFQNEYMYADNYKFTFSGKLPQRKTKIKPLEFSIFAGGTSAFIISQHIIQKQTIWAETADFRFIEDGNYALWVDKVGHFYGAYLGSYAFNEFLTWSGFSTEAAHLIGMGLGLSYSTYVEIMDGFGKNWGFSPSDFYSDVSGSLFFILQYYVPVLQNFTPKFNYIPSPWYGELKRKEAELFIDDYNGQTFWMSVKVHNLLPHDLKKYWPDWLELSFGYAGRNVMLNPTPSNPDWDPKKSPVLYDGIGGSPRYIIALDYDLVKILPDGGSFWNWLRQTINLVKLPSPAIEFGETTKLYLLYPFHF